MKDESIVCKLGFWNEEVALIDEVCGLNFKGTVSDLMWIAKPPRLISYQGGPVGCLLE